MKNIISLLGAFFISAIAFTQDINIGVEAKTEINVEDKSVEAVREMYRMESLILNLHPIEVIASHYMDLQEI